MNFVDSLNREREYTLRNQKAELSIDISEQRKSRLLSVFSILCLTENGYLRFRFNSIDFVLMNVNINKFDTSCSNYFLKVHFNADRGFRHLL